MNGVSKTSATPPVPTGSRRWTALTVVVLLSPCLASAVFAMRDAAAPALKLSEGRPALVFGAYMIPASREPMRDEPIISQDFDFLNKGKETVRITDLVPDCACLSPTISSREILPGDFGRITLPIRTTNEPAGLNEYLLTVKYEDPKPRQVTLTLKVNLPEKQLVIQPRVLMVMGKVTGEHPYIVTISDYRPDSITTPMKITGVASSSSLFTAETAGHSTADGVTTSAVSVTFNEPIPAGQHKGVILVSTDDRLFPTLQIPVIVGDQKRPADEPVSISPDAARVVIDTTEPEKSLGTNVSFDIPTKWTVSHFDAFPPALAARVLTTEPVTAETVRVTVELTVSALPARGVERGVLTLHATDGSDPEMVTVPVSLTWK